MPGLASLQRVSLFQPIAHQLILAQQTQAPWRDLIDVFRQAYVDTHVTKVPGRAERLAAMGGLCQRLVTSGEGWSAQGNVAVDGALGTGREQVDATALAQAA